MTTKHRLIPLVIAMTAILTTTSALSAGQNGRQPTRPTLSALDAQEAATLTFMREEERLARDVYVEMDGLWEALPFASIATSEQRHMDAIKSQMDKYGLPDPSDPNATGVFADGELQQLYDTLTAEGARSYVEALQVGALIEEVDIEDLEVAIAATDNTDLQKVYDNLLRGSRNHLRAFVAEIERQGVVYEAQYLDQAAVDAIVDSPMERGGSAGGQAAGSKGAGKGQGARAGQAALTLRAEPLVARHGSGAGNGSGSRTRKGGGTGDCRA